MVHWVGTAMSHLQGLFSALFCLTNPDIWRSFFILVTCSRATAEGLEDAPDLRPKSTAGNKLSMSRTSFAVTQHAGSSLTQQMQHRGSSDLVRNENTDSARQTDEGDEVELGKMDTEVVKELPDQEEGPSTTHCHHQDDQDDQDEQ
eukprot:Nitzschia sp. Nitz4//scaffold263_size26989//14067//14504//NITZ4_008225-RA/size26989-processed-gene-0.10-mRNA-1//-1//CDS//3329544769//7550//frame0